MNSGSDVSKALGALLHVGQDERDAGVATGEQLAKMGDTKEMRVNHEVGNVALDQRCAGFAEGFGGDSSVLPIPNDPPEVEAEMRAALEADEAISAVIGLSAPLAGEPAMVTLSGILNFLSPGAQLGLPGIAAATLMIGGEFDSPGARTGSRWSRPSTTGGCGST